MLNSTRGMATLRNIIHCVFVVFLFWTCVTHSQDDCHPDTGPAGTMCVLIPNYDDYQLATCASPSYIASVSNNTFQCLDPCRNYCWLPCMAERFGALNGSIDSTCQCAQSDGWCLRETGSCSFFQSCLASNFMCPPPSFADFGNLFCEIITNYVQDDRANCTDKAFLRDLRVCLQREIIPNILQNASLTCDEITVLGFGFVNDCLSNVCSLSENPRLYLSDYLDVSPAKGAFPSQVNEIQGILSNCTS